jgi:hypothetical protein
MVLCTEQSLVKHEGQGITVRPLRCKCWGCDHCKHQRKRDLFFKALRGDPRIFLTLTMRKGQYNSPDEQAEAFVVGWRMLRQFLCRQLGRKKIDFIAIFEKHKSGWPHLHILLRGGYIDHRIIRGWWKSRFNSIHINIKLARNGNQAAHYVTKYVSDDPAVFGTLKRYWSSQGWEKKRPDSGRPVYGEDVWFERYGMHPMNMARVALSDGARVTFKGDSIIIERWSGPDERMWGVGKWAP